MESKILFSIWGQGNTYVTFVRVIKESPKTLLVEELINKDLSKEELKEKNLSIDFSKTLQNYCVPSDQVKIDAGRPIKFRLYKEDDSDYFFTNKKGFCQMYQLWDSKPVLEDLSD